MTFKSFAIKRMVGTCVPMAHQVCMAAKCTCAVQACNKQTMRTMKRRALLYVQQ